ncbi:hypothetical protein WJX72_011851 [[Myrmecia] bisecta]|uniref:G-patch domain-containing protein n=1 Tax=[Myrmecia] bisecta TaxID=41462 RepID=A0AAW1R9D4_9CHLO
MAQSDDDEDYVHFGTGLAEEEESRAGQRKKDVTDPALTRSLPVWKQEVTDSEGRRRFHGAFTGGYSAGYYNTVGSLEGWAPKTFKSSREQRTDRRQQNVEDFMDEDELAELRKHSLQQTAEYDTFGSTAAEVAKRAIAAEAVQRPSAIPGAVLEVLAPVADSIGINLLQKMGWRQGKGIGTAAAGAAGGGDAGSKWGRVAGVGVANTPIYALQPKSDVHGLGFDPYKGAEEFRAAKRMREEPVQNQGAGPGGALKRSRGPAFGTGALEEDDTYGMMEDYVTAEAGAAQGMHFEIASDNEEDEVMPARKDGAGMFRLPGAAPIPLRLQANSQHRKEGALIAGFLKAASLVPATYFPAPKVPPDFRPYHTFKEGDTAPQAKAAAQRTVVASAPPPSDQELRRTIDTLAVFVARNGAAFEALARERNAADPNFAFLVEGGAGGQYYRWKVDLLRQASPSVPVARRSTPLTADERANGDGKRRSKHSIKHKKDRSKSKKEAHLKRKKSGHKDANKRKSKQSKSNSRAGGKARRADVSDSSSAPSESA